jgi:hypothetical protein
VAISVATTIEAKDTPTVPVRAAGKTVARNGDAHARAQNGKLALRQHIKLELMILLPRVNGFDIPWVGNFGDEAGIEIVNQG